jgi:hypothetical protein
MRLTIFTAPKPFQDAHINVIQRNALQSWLHLGEQVRVVILGDEMGMAEVAAEYGIQHIKDVRLSSYGTPLIPSIFEQARQAYDHPIQAYVNADILLLPDFLSTAQQVAAQCEQFLVVGQRWDLDVRQALDFSAGWEARLRAWVQAQGKLHRTTGSDYFIFPRQCYQEIPDLAVGRSMWDNWMIYQARKQGWAVVDATTSATIIHQNHDYSHLPSGLPHYRQPETAVNIRLAGGRRRALRLEDATHLLADGEVLPRRWTPARILRSIEVFPIVQLDSYRLAQLFFAIFHPLRAFRKTRRALRKKVSTLIKQPPQG